MAERTGFEPLWGCPQTVFKTASLWPLRYLSVYELPSGRYHRIFNFFRNIFRNAVFDCCRSAEKVRCHKAFQGFCDRCARKFSRPPRYDRFDTSPYMKLSFDRNHQIFNCFRNYFRNALFCCCRSTEKVRCCKVFPDPCDRCARKFSSSPCSDYFTFQQQKHL